ncbi:peptidoglycan recognition protein family protein [Jatrophihabitans fulvus]
MCSDDDAIDLAAPPSRRAFLAGAAAAALGVTALGSLAAAPPAEAVQVRLTWLPDVLRAEGCTVIEQGDWLDRSRPTGDFTPYGVLLHHTAGGVDASSSNPAPTLNTVIDGRSDLAGPLCHILIDRNGACRLIAGGRANHAGEARASGPMPAGDGNTLFVGIEIDYNATGVDTGQHPSSAQREAAVAAATAIVRHYGNDGSYVRAHRETSVTGKIDPSFFDMDTVRAQVNARL